MTYTSYEDSPEHIVDELRRIDLLVQLYLEEWRANTASTEGGTAGFYISDEEVDRLLRRDRSPSTTHDRQLRDQIETVTQQIHERKRRTVRGGPELRLVTLAERFDLTQRHVDALLLSLAPEFDRKYEKIYAYLQDDITRKRPTVGLVLRVLTESERERLGGRALFSETSPLIQNRILVLSPTEDNASLLSHLATADQRILDFLLDIDGVDPVIRKVAEVESPDARIEDLPLDDQTRERVARLAPTSDSDSTPVMRYVYGPYGVGKDISVEAMCRDAETALVRADILNAAGTDFPDSLNRLLREARLRGAALHLKNGNRLPGEDGQSMAAVARKLDRFEGNVFLTGEEEWRPERGIDTHEFVSLRLPRPGFQRRKKIWEQLAKGHSDEIDAADLAAKFRLTRGQIEDAVATAHALENDEELSSDAVYRGCRIQSRHRLSSLARKTEPTYTWKDIVLPEDEKRQLREVAAHVKHRGTVYAEWGFEDRFSLGNGLNVLFSGPSGTGKTMAAEIIARDAGLDMFKIDLASVVSKYIGETEKNLKRIFDEAEYTDAILFFDEADALFGERSEVSDANDRYANVEVSYLLQRMEEHDGAVILATNFKENIDDAFLRRTNLNVEFTRPDRESRTAIWRNIFPEETPVRDLDVEFLSSFKITGGNIRNVALTASFLAADDDGMVEMEHVVQALRRELQKTGRLVDPEEFGEYRELVR